MISYFVKSLMNTCPRDCLRYPGLARYHPFLDGTLSLRCATSRYLMSLKYETLSNDERKVPFKNDDYLASGTSSFRKACKSYLRDNKI